MITKEYDGFIYHPEEECDNDGCRIWHTVTGPDGSTVYADFSPYSELTQEELELWIDLGMPARIGIGPLDMTDLLTIQEERDFNEYDGQPDEAQEWYDFDPDC